MNKEEFTKELSEQLSTLKGHAEEMNKLVEDLQLLVRPTGDVTFGAMDRTKSVLTSIKDAKEATEKVKKVLKLRAAERMKEG